MKKVIIILTVILIFFNYFGINSIPAFSQDSENLKSIDEKVEKFLDSHQYTWRDMNVSASDGKILYDLIIQNNYTKALEIGTSTGHSGIWIAWALSKTGGKLITIDIDEERYREAIENFKEAGVSEYIDARPISLSMNSRVHSISYSVMLINTG
jgi:predicted O-methyltransferase YrrM